MTYEATDSMGMTPFLSSDSPLLAKLALQNSHSKNGFLTHELAASVDTSCIFSILSMVPPTAIVATGELSALSILLVGGVSIRELSLLELRLAAKLTS